MNELSKYFFCVVVCVLALVAGQLNIILFSFMCVVLFFITIKLINSLVAVFKVGPSIDLQNINTASYSVMNYPPIVSTLFKEFLIELDPTQTKTLAEISNIFCHRYNIPAVLHTDMNIILKKILFEFEKINGSLQPQMVQLNKLNISHVRSSVTDMPQFVVFCNKLA